MNIALELACVQAASAFFIRVCELKAPEFDCPVREAGMVVQHVVPARIVVRVPLAELSGVPKVGKLAHRGRLTQIQPPQEVFVDRAAVMLNTRPIEPQCGNDEVLVACHDVREVAECLGIVPVQSDVDVYAAHVRRIAFRAPMTELAENFLQILDVSIAENRGAQLGAFLVACGLDARIARDLPLASKGIPTAPCAVAAADVPNGVLGMEVLRNRAARFLARDVVHLDLHADGLAFHGFDLASGLFVHLYVPAFRKCVFLFAVTYSLCFDDLSRRSSENKEKMA